MGGHWLKKVLLFIGGSIVAISSSCNMALCCPGNEECKNQKHTFYFCNIASGLNNRSRVHYTGIPVCKECAGKLNMKTLNRFRMMLNCNYSDFFGVIKSKYFWWMPMEIVSRQFKCKKKFRVRLEKDFKEVNPEMDESRTNNLIDLLGYDILSKWGRNLYSFLSLSDNKCERGIEIIEAMYNMAKLDQISSFIIESNFHNKQSMPKNQNSNSEDIFDFLSDLI